MVFRPADFFTLARDYQKAPWFLYRFFLPFFFNIFTRRFRLKRIRSSRCNKWELLGLKLWNHRFATVSSGGWEIHRKFGEILQVSILEYFKGIQRNFPKFSKNCICGRSISKIFPGLVKVKQAHLKFLRSFFYEELKWQFSCSIISEQFSVWSLHYKSQKFMQVLWGLLLFWALKIACKQDFFE